MGENDPKGGDRMNDPEEQVEALVIGADPLAWR
jgi:hypothetical protein